MRSNRRSTSVGSASDPAPLLRTLSARAPRRRSRGTRVGEQFVFDEAVDARRLVGEERAIELTEDAGMRAGQQVGGDLAAPLGAPGVR